MQRAAGFVIYRKIFGNVQYLLLQTSYGEKHWTPPKEAGENDMAAALRETEEESGLIRKDLRIYHDVRKVLNYNVAGKPKMVTYWLAELINPETTIRLSDEHQDFKWLPLETAVIYGKYKEMHELLHFCDDFIRSRSENN